MIRVREDSESRGCGKRILGKRRSGAGGVGGVGCHSFATKFVLTRISLREYFKLLYFILSKFA